MYESSRKAINNPKLISFNWLKEQNLKDVRNVLKDQKIRRFLEMSRNTYPDLIKVFYTNLLIDGENMYSHVKGVDMEIAPYVDCYYGAEIHWVKDQQMEYMLNKGFDVSKYMKIG